MIPKRQLLLICKRLKVHKELVSQGCIHNWLTISEVSLVAQRRLSKWSASSAKITPHDTKFTPSSKSYENDFGSFQDEDQWNSYQHGSDQKYDFGDAVKSDTSRVFDKHPYQRFHQHHKRSGPKDRQGSEDFTSFLRQHKDMSHPRHRNHNQFDMSDLRHKVQSKGRTFQETLSIVKDLYSEHPNVTSRDMDDIQNFQDKYDISITGSQKKRPIFNFEEAGFPENILSALKSMEFKEPSPIQCIAWPHALSGSDIVGIAQTGSGKTLSFILPAIVHVMKRKQSSKRLRKPLALVICPTRELALQVCQVAAGLRTYCGISSIPVYGGQSKTVQINNLRKMNPEIVVATPGRLMDLLACDAISLDQVTYVVLDEADRMLDMGFEPQIRSIMDHIQSQRQVLMFSATWPTEVHDIANDYLNDYVHLKIGATHHTINSDIQQEFVKCDNYDKDAELIELLQNNFDDGEQVKTLVFCARKVTCERVHNALRRSGIVCQYIHGDCSQFRRDQVMSSFRKGTSKVLIATDVAARGIDVSDIGFVINYDMPNNVDNYIHRVGRTARAGKKGNAVSFITEDDFGIIQSLTALLEDINHEVPKFFHTLDYQGRRLKSAKKALKNSQRLQYFRPRKFRY